MKIDVQNKRVLAVINGKKPWRSWADNPWVWVVEFKLVQL